MEIDIPRARHEVLEKLLADSSSSISPRREVVTETSVEPGDQKTCPSCAETVRAKAKICRFCGHVFDEAAPTREAARWANSMSFHLQPNRFWAVVAGSIALIVVLLVATAEPGGVRFEPSAIACNQPFTMTFDLPDSATRLELILYKGRGTSGRALTSASASITDLSEYRQQDGSYAVRNKYASQCEPGDYTVAFRDAATERVLSEGTYSVTADVIAPSSPRNGGSSSPSVSPVVVPVVTNLSSQQAKAAIEKAGLVMEIDGTAIDSTVVPDTVVAQNPAAGSGIAAGDTVHVTVSAYPGYASFAP
jgi:hypothetical protein